MVEKTERTKLFNLQTKGDIGMSDGNAKATIMYVDDLLKMDLRIPEYQRPYKWIDKNVSDLWSDINSAIADREKYGKQFKYRIGTVILHHTENDLYNIVDGQQRIITLSLIKYALCGSFEKVLQVNKFSDDVSKKNIHDNNLHIRKLLSDDQKQAMREAFADILEVVVVTVEKVAEAFQLFDSQNTRGRSLDPHDLLKAYHLRKMRDDPSKQRKLVTRWEAIEPQKIRDLFARYLYPILHWARKEKPKAFTAQDIDAYKGVDAACPYTYARRVRNAMPFFQIDESFQAGSNFFLMVEYYVGLLAALQQKIANDAEFESIRNILNAHIKDAKDEAAYTSIGSRYAETLFYCALLFYYDRFDVADTAAVKNLFAWAMMIRVDMNHLGIDTINNYAIGNKDKDYTNHVPMFYKIATARKHSDIAHLQIAVVRTPDMSKSSTWENLYNALKELMEVKQ